MKKQLLFTALLIALIALMGNTLVAQQSSSVTQVVTFGVSRMTQAVVASVSSLTSTGPTVDVSDLKMAERKLAALPAKVTYSSGLKHSAVSPGRNIVDADPLTSATAQNSGVSIFEHDASVQKDLRAILQQEQSAFRNTSSLVLTITD